ncbi:hypothetical protein IAT38_002074 [Cryptococcus sp. DSM 104549]
MPAHILAGNVDLSLPAAENGCSAPLTATPYSLTKSYTHLVEDVEQHREVLTEKLGKLQAGLPQLGEHDLRQAKADIVYLRSILDGEEPNIAQVRAGAAFSAAGP